MRRDLRNNAAPIPLEHPPKKSDGSSGAKVRQGDHDHFTAGMTVCNSQEKHSYDLQGMAAGHAGIPQSLSSAALMKGLGIRIIFWKNPECPFPPYLRKSGTNIKRFLRTEIRTGIPLSIKN